MPVKSLEIHSSQVPLQKATLSLRSLDRAQNVRAKLFTNRAGRKEVILLGLGRPVVIGRNHHVCNYVIPDIVVSNIHCKLYAIPSGSGGVIISCQDMSTNGIILNGDRIHKTSVILMDGDSIEIPHSQSFSCIHMQKNAREKAHIFDPTPPGQTIRKRISNYVVTSHCLGSGTFATVHLAVDTNAHRQVACKSIKTKKENDMKLVMKEFTILMSLNHPNINKVYDLHVDGKFLHIFLQLCTGGDLFTYITNYAEPEHRLVEGEAKYIMFQLLKGLLYLHNKKISHRDLKPENILLHCPGPYPRIQIADFGLARPKAYQETLNVCGTIAYLPPEGILALDNKHLGYLGMPSDCWSAGVILFIMLSGYHPFDCDRELSEIPPDSDFTQSEFSPTAEQHIKARIVDGELCFPSDIWNSIPDARSLVNSLLTNDPFQRMTVDGALLSRWIAEDSEELEQAYIDRMAFSDR